MPETQELTQPMEGLLARWRWREAEAGDGGAVEMKLDADPLLNRLLAARGVADAAAAERYLRPSLKHLHDPATLVGANAAAHRLAEAIRVGQPIVIYGDYDVDGVTASAILYHTLRQAGGDVTTYVPHRIDEGYGLNTAAIERFAAAEPRPVVVSVDCGITATEPARLAKSLGLELIITDHHHFDADDLPDAVAVVHPGLRDRATDAAYPCPDLCGAGVAFKLAWQFARVHCGTDKLPMAFKDLMVDLLSLVALGTVADVVPLRGENRVLTVFGLGRIKQTRFAGLTAMIEAARLMGDTIDAYHIGFVLGPRLNACGRMGHAERAVRLLTVAEGEQAAEIAEFLSSENDRRRAEERRIFDEAVEMIDSTGYATPDRRAIVLGREGWHPGVIGIVASRLVERYCRPVAMLAVDGERAQGSARSVDGVHLHEALSQCGAYLDRFGGHAMAAGMSLPAKNLEAFREALVASVNGVLGEDELHRSITVDAEITLSRCTLAVFDRLGQMAPFGRGNPGPRLLVRGATLDRAAEPMGQRGRHLTIHLRQNGARARAVAFGMGDYAASLPAGVEADLVFTPKVSTWRGQRRIELHVQDLRVRQMAR